MRDSAIGLFLNTGLAATTAEPDERLLSDFFANRDERAFAAIVRRHQRTVWGVCKRMLNNSADAEDAFQATFLVLVCRGRTLAERGSVGGWLYRVAHRIAMKARNMANKRRLCEERAAKSDGFIPNGDESSDLMVVVGEELERLPENHRLAVIVCDLDGLSRTKAAERLGCSEGTLSSRLHRGRKELAERLKIRGISVPLAGLGAIFVAVSPAPASLGSTTAGLAQTVSVLGISNRVVSAKVAALFSQTTREMVMRFTTKVLAAIALSSGLIGGGWLGWNPGAPSALQAAPVLVAKGDTKIELPGSAYELLRMRKVLKELKCTPEQRVQIEDAFDDLAEKPDKIEYGIQLNAGNAGNVQAIQAQIDEQMKKQREAAEAFSKEIGEKHLKKEQLIRLGQILIQTKGVKAFTDEKIVEELKLTDDQKKTVSEAIRELESPVETNLALPAALPGGAAIPVAPGGAVAGFAVKAWSPQPDAKKRAAAVEKVVDALSKDQQATWKKLVGEKIGFELPTAMYYGGLNTVRFAAPLPAAPALPVAPPPAPEKP